MASSTGEVLLPAGDLSETIDYFADELGFRMVLISPADDPSEAVLEGLGITVRLVPDLSGSTALRLPSDQNRPSVVAPNGTEVRFFVPSDELDLGPLERSFVVSRSADGHFGAGRAGMGYRDLIPNRQGGRFIASHIHIPDGGPVPDYVHHHHILFQMIFCYRGWADLVYEDQGPPFRMNAGDCVLQPPHIRHRVLATSADFDVVEIGCPARHDTLRDHELALPNETIAPDRDFGGQRFVWHRASAAMWKPWRQPGFESQDFGFAEATGSVATASVVRAAGADRIEAFEHQRDLHFWFVMQGGLVLSRNGKERHRLGPADSVTLPAGEVFEVAEVSADLELLEVLLPGAEAAQPS
mgnify:CR=1 FL=1